MIFTNQLREKIGVMFGSPETTSGGRALKFYASIRLDIRRIQTIKQGGDMVGNRTRVRVTKNKLAAPFRECEFDIMYGTGISYAGDLLDLATELGFIDKRGAFFRYNDELLGQGRENAKKFLEERPEYCQVLDQAVREASALRPLQSVRTTGPDADDNGASGEDD
jgi:recombination protein RecA